MECTALNTGLFQPLLAVSVDFHWCTIISFSFSLLVCFLFLGYDSLWWTQFAISSQCSLNISTKASLTRDYFTVPDMKFSWLQNESYITLHDLKGCRLSGSVFNILFNLNKFMAFETRDPFLIRQVLEMFLVFNHCLMIH